jgi:A/G-specific adenine glycosylase
MGELCLARTRSVLVPQLFARLKELAPSPSALAARPDALDVLTDMGLGARAKVLVDVARELTELHGGSVPEDELVLRSLPGVGDNVAQAVICFGFSRRAVLLDRTTTRIVTRFCGRSDTRRWQTRLDLYRLAGSSGPDSEFNYALIDHGALICRSDLPRCDACVLRDRCAAFAGITSASELAPPKEACVDAA